MAPAIRLWPPLASALGLVTLWVASKAKAPSSLPLVASTPQGICELATVRDFIGADQKASYGPEAARARLALDYPTTVLLTGR